MLPEDSDIVQVGGSDEPIASRLRINVMERGGDARRFRRQKKRVRRVSLSVRSFIRKSLIRDSLIAPNEITLEIA